MLVRFDIRRKQDCSRLSLFAQKIFIESHRINLESTELFERRQWGRLRFHASIESGSFLSTPPWKTLMGQIIRQIRALASRRSRRMAKDRKDSYAQEGEDLVLSVLMEPNFPEHGFYVDIGAHHPTRFSNTMYFYQRGWRGLNVDARPGFAVDFTQTRPRDTAIECGVSGQAGELLFYEFNEPALSTFDIDLARRRDGTRHYHIEREVTVPLRTLASLMEEHVGREQVVDFLTIDVEGLDVDVLRSGDWTAFRPRFVLAEVYGRWLDDVMDSPTVGVMADLGYRPCSRTRHTVFFEDTHCDVTRAAA